MLFRSEAGYLRERIIVSHRDSLLAFLVDECESSETAFAWEHPQRGRFREPFDEQLFHARLFSEGLHGAQLLYNLLLAGIVIFHFMRSLPSSKVFLQFDLLLFLFVMAVLANVAYCAAYIPDVFAQMSNLRESWLRYRWALLLVGMAFAGVLTHFWTVGMFGNVAR